jgi:outer membrane lipoprotein-sorting protein
MWSAESRQNGFRKVFGMKTRLPLIVVFLAAFSPFVLPQVAKPAGGSELERVLVSMDRASESFRTAQADFVWEQFQQVVNETDVQKGVIYFRRQSKDVQMAADIRDPDSKYVLYADEKVRVYQPRIDQITEYSAGKNKQDFESFLVLGFGARGHDLLRSFDVSYAGSEQVQGQAAAKLALVPKSDRARGMFNRILLWIDPVRGVSVQQQFLEPSGDFRMCHYSNIKINASQPENAFKLRTTGKTKTVRPQG